MRDPTQASTASTQSPAAQEAPPGKLPPLPLAAAGLTALNALLALACLGLFLWDYRAATRTIQGTAPLLALLGIAAVTVGATILVKNKRSGRAMDGSIWANPAVVAGLLIMTAAVFLPLLSALAMLVDDSARP